MTSIDQNEALRKKQALRSYLANSSPTTKTQMNQGDKKAISQIVLQNVEHCSVCAIGVKDAKANKKICGFCQAPACNEHMVKRRRKKNKWERICDNCEDQFLFDAYMKLEIKAEESLAVEEKIVTMKLQDLKQIQDNKRAKLRELTYEKMQLETNYQERISIQSKEQSKLMSANNKVESGELACGEMAKYLQDIQNKGLPNFEENFKLLSQQNSRLAGDLFGFEKRCEEIRTLIRKRQKQFQSAYEQWEQRQRKGKGATSSKKSNDECCIF